MRYVPFIALSVTGFVVLVAGLLSWGVPAAYGGAALTILGVGGAYADHLRREDLHTR